MGEGGAEGKAFKNELNIQTISLYLCMKINIYLIRIVKYNWINYKILGGDFYGLYWDRHRQKREYIKVF